MNNILKIYQRLPYGFRTVVASAWGYYLRWWRYGTKTDKLVADALERESWSAKQWKMWKEERLSYILSRAATRVPYYRDQWEKRRKKGDKASWEYLENWLHLEKDAVRDNPYAFIADDCKPSRMFHEHTSGTTGKSLDLWWSKDTVLEWYALMEARCRYWYDVSRHDRWAILGGKLVTPVGQKKPPFWVWNKALNQLYLSSYHLSPAFIPHYLSALVRYRIQYLWGYTSSLYALADHTLRVGQDAITMSVVISNAEPVYDYQRDVIERAFNCSLRDTYGMAEIVAAASECEEKNLHLWPEVGIIEIDSAEGSNNGDQSGDFICTGLLNSVMPLIRYRVGDRGVMSDTNKNCSCQRTLPILAKLDGRSDDILYTTDGRIIGRLDPVFKTHLPVIEAQVIQEAYDRVIIRFVPAPNYTSEAGRSMISRLQDRMGPVDVILEPTDLIPREANGKFKAVISRVGKPDYL